MAIKCKVFEPLTAEHFTEADNLTLAQILEQLKQIEQNNPSINNKADVVAGAGGYYNFPHTRNYDTDLGFLIDMYKLLTQKYEDMNITFIEFIEILTSILTQIDTIVIEEVNKALADGKIFLTTEYDAENKKLKFIFKEV